MIKEKIEETKNMFLQSSLDKENKKKFQEIIQEQFNDRNSKFNEFGLRTDKEFTEIGYVIDIPEEYQSRGKDWQIMDKLNENGYFVTMYLKKELGFENYVSNPKYYHIEDPSDETSLSCSYLATWNYTPMLQKEHHNKILKIKVISGIGIGGIIAGIAALLVL